MKKVTDFTKSIQLVQDALANVPFIDLAELRNSNYIESKDNGIDIVTEILTPKPQRLAIQIISEGSPRRIREAAYKINEAQKTQYYKSTYAIIVAPRISEAGATICKSANIGYVDHCGSVFLNFDKIYIEKRDDTSHKKKKRRLQSIYSPKSSRILRVMLTEPYRRWKVEELSRTADVSLGLVSNVINALGNQEWIEEHTQSGFNLSNPDALLMDWSSQYDYKKNDINSYYSVMSMSEIEAALQSFSKQLNCQFALTLFSGASRIAPYTRFNQVFVYLDTDITVASKELGFKQVDSGPNVSLLRPYDNGVFYGTKEYNSIPIVSPIQLYLDLASYKGRGREAADHLFERVIQPQWLQNQTTANGK